MYPLEETAGVAMILARSARLDADKSCRDSNCSKNEHRRAGEPFFALAIIEPNRCRRAIRLLLRQVNQRVPTMRLRPVVAPRGHRSPPHIRRSNANETRQTIGNERAARTAAHFSLFSAFP